MKIQMTCAYCKKPFYVSEAQAVMMKSMGTICCSVGCAVKTIDEQPTKES